MHATPPLNTLERIAKTSILRVGYGDTAPFSYLNNQGQVVGYSIDICQRLAKQLKENLGLSSLEIVYVPRTPSNRVQLLNRGDIDIECNASTNTAERRRSVLFALSHYFVTVRYVALRESGFRTLDDLAGQSVSVARGTVNIGQVNQANRQHQLYLSVVLADTLQEAFDLVTEGRVAAFAMDDILLSAMIAESENPYAYTLSAEPLTESQPLGFMMRTGDDAFADQVNKSLHAIYTSPDMESIYDRWFHQPLPGKGVTLNVPMSDVLAEHFTSLRDFPSRYGSGLSERKNSQNEAK
ncbi:amino acid ABC transporter substrate-binding protein [Halovibrio sp. HP20-50]|uniref:amino acid ABC transporter substrate-binding protein n=1 Tax=Halovibrio sp. HP20-59 TaxID=3080275 RepID=UPI00294B3571|nr:amino acid ABC transporter substrate-binding protein [Halovibrio sp. HP20-59]MEA2117675.1 amino acid ABC transporter substrate-binding protein [Halovibrio sp. HP20-59]